MPPVLKASKTYLGASQGPSRRVDGQGGVRDSMSWANNSARQAAFHESFLNRQLWCFLLLQIGVRPELDQSRSARGPEKEREKAFLQGDPTVNAGSCIAMSEKQCLITMTLGAIQ